MLLISAGLTEPKKRDHPFARKHRYLNYGLLTLATLISDAGVSAQLIHGEFEDPEELAEEITSTGHGHLSHPLLLSLPSYFSIPWAQAFVKRIKRNRPGILIVVGGRWVVGDAQWVRSKLPEIDLVVFGTAEDRVVDLLFPERWPFVGGTDRSLMTTRAKSPVGYVRLRYELIRYYRDYHPSIEVARGCGMKCGFCEERDVPRTAMRGPEDVALEMEWALQLYEDSRLRFYLEASLFSPTKHWADRLAATYRDRSLTTEWRCESRVDSLSRLALPSLARAGLRVLDLGLESASTKQLRAMGKTQDAKRYLERASELLRCCHENGIWAKINVLLYPGESADTLSETTAWLVAHESYIKGVSAGPLVVYGTNDKANDYLAIVGALGARPVDPNSGSTCGYTRLHLSPEFDADAVEEACLNLTRRFMTHRDYFDLKSFTYLPRSYDYSMFANDVRGANPKTLPFSVESL